MKLVRRFVLAEVVWTTGIFIVLVAVGIAGSDTLSAGQVVRWLARALGLAAFPSGIAIAANVFDDQQPWRRLFTAIMAAMSLSAVIVILLAVVGPAVSAETRSLSQLIEEMGGTGNSWESRNDAAWRFYAVFVEGLNAWLFAAIGLQAGIWARHSLPRSLRRGFYWTAGLGLLISGFGIWDTTYETFVLHTEADASFAVWYTVLIPAAVCAGLALPTLALLRRTEIAGNSS